MPFTVVASAGREAAAGADPAALARANALAKAQGALLPEGPEESAGVFILGTDTVVATERQVLGKPVDRAQAAAMLRTLQGREHEVISAVALLRLGPEAEPPPGGAAQQVIDHAGTRVRFCALAPAEIEAYLDSGEWAGKAGAYAIQGLASLFIERIEGEYSNVVGLPLFLLARTFRQLGFDLLRRRWFPAPKQV